MMDMNEERYLKMPIRPHAEESEGVAEYLQRLAKANGFNSVRPVLDFIGAPLNDIVVAGHEKLRNVISGKSPTSSLKTSKLTKGIPSPAHRNLGVSSTARVCCSCLRQSDVIAAEWSRPLSIICSIHNEILLDKCPNCERKIVRHESQYQCKCGQMFKDVSTALSPPWLDRFYELFAPWKQYPPSGVEQSTIIQADTFTSRLINRLLTISRGDSESRFGFAAWIDVSDLDILEDLCHNSTKLDEIIQKLKHIDNICFSWEHRIISLCHEMPLVLQAFEVSRKRSGLLHRKNRLTETLIASNISDILKVSHRIAISLIRDISWQGKLRKSINSNPGDCLLTCVNKWVKNTYSAEEVKTLTGLSGHWLYTFFNDFKTSQLGTSLYITWRFPKDPIDQVISGIQRCLEFGKEFIKNCDGFIPLNSFPKQGEVLKKHTFQLVIDGSLPLVPAMEKSSTFPGLLDCVVPASAIELFQPDRFMRVNFPSLIQYPDLRPCLS